MCPTEENRSAAAEVPRLGPICGEGGAERGGLGLNHPVDDEPFDRNLLLFAYCSCATFPLGPTGTTSWLRHRHENE